MSTGMLPNLGANDGALFFQFTESAYNDYRPQLNSLHLLLTGSNLYGKAGDWQEDAAWYGLRQQQKAGFPVLKQEKGFVSFPIGGYYLIRDTDTLSLLRCTKFRNRPSHADNLHLDVWVGAKNLLHDAGSYKYNTAQELKRYFKGTQSHNTVMIDDLDQMLMGDRFMWYHWSEAVDVKLSEDDEYYIFEGTIKAFGHLTKNARHTRTVKKKKGANHWLVLDEVQGLPPQHMMKQLWHTVYPGETDIRVLTGEADLTQAQGWHSRHYGAKEPCTEIVITTENRHIQTLIQTT